MIENVVLARRGTCPALGLTQMPHCPPARGTHKRSLCGGGTPHATCAGNSIRGRGPALQLSASFSTAGLRRRGGADIPPPDIGHDRGASSHRRGHGLLQKRHFGSPTAFHERARRGKARGQVRTSRLEDRSALHVQRTLACLRRIGGVRVWRVADTRCSRSVQTKLTPSSGRACRRG